VNLCHDTAVVTGIYQTRGAYGGKPYENTGRFTTPGFSRMAAGFARQPHQPGEETAPGLAVS
jgi:hypothetical protein